MSRRRRNNYGAQSNRAIVNFESESFATQSSNNNNQSSNVQNNDEVDYEECIVGMNDTETKVLISNCIRYIILNENTKSLIKQTNINKHLNENFNLDRSQQNRLMQMVMRRLWKDFGLIMIEVENSPKAYILHTIYSNDLLALDDIDDDIDHTNDDVDVDENSFDNTIIPDDYDDEIEPNNEDCIIMNGWTYDEIIDQSKNTLLLIILSFILIKEDETISESELFKSLEDIGICMTSKYETGRDCTKQNICELISKEFVRHYYLKRMKRKQPAKNEIEYIYEWGIRSQYEFKRMDIVNFITDIYDDNDKIQINLLRDKALKYDEKREKEILDRIKMITNKNNLDNELHNNNDDDDLEIDSSMNIETSTNPSRRKSPRQSSAMADHSHQQKRTTKNSRLNETSMESKSSTRRQLARRRNYN